MISVVLVCLVMFASGCASNNDPSNWEEAIADGTLEENFMRSCREADAGTLSAIAGHGILWMCF